jgi:hypothetical protein
MLNRPTETCRIYDSDLYTSQNMLTSMEGRAIAKAVSRRFPTRVRARVRSCGICGG